jgi:hypothetical protein
MDTVKRRHRLGFVLLALAAGLAQGPRPAEAGGIAVVAQTPQQRQIADWALDRYAEAGLRLPPIRIVFHPLATGCHGNSGWYQGNRIDLCVSDQTEAYARRTLVHELGHAWVAATLTDAEREAFLQGRGLESWNSREVPWVERAFEQAAELITWGVGARETRILLPDHGDPEALGAAFELLTGVPPVA